MPIRFDVLTLFPGVFDGFLAEDLDPAATVLPVTVVLLPVPIVAAEGPVLPYPEGGRRSCTQGRRDQALGRVDHAEGLAVVNLALLHPELGRVAAGAGQVHRHGPRAGLQRHCPDQVVDGHIVALELEVLGLLGRAGAGEEKTG